MKYISDVNRLHPIVEHTPMRDVNINYSGLDYSHINSLSNKNILPVVRRVEPINSPNVVDTRGVSSELEVPQKQGPLDFSLRDTNMLSMYSDITSPKVDTFTLIEDNQDDDNDIIYSAAPKIGGGKNSTPFSTPSRDITILDAPTRSGDTHPSVLQNRNARMNNGIGKN